MNMIARLALALAPLALIGVGCWMMYPPAAFVAVGCIAWIEVRRLWSANK